MLAQQARKSQKRAIFFVFDGGTGVGHLRRLAHIARRLQGPFSCLIVTGHRAAAHWFVPEECEYIHLPSWDSLLESKARYWGRQPFIILDEVEAVRLRTKLLMAVVESFNPDVMFVDHVPLGFHEELVDVIENTTCLKYLVSRGVLNQSGDLLHLIFGDKPTYYLTKYYQRIFVALDQKVFDFASQYRISSELHQKTIHTGYVVEGMTKDTVARIRAERGLGSGDTWVVASAGGGQLGERLIESCLELAERHMDVFFDIVLGPRSRLRWEDQHKAVVVRGKLHLHKEVPQMPYLHASADLVISSGGYNSLMETLQGNARILCFPLWKDPRDEQYRHAACLKKFIDIELSTDLSELPRLFAQAVDSSGRGVHHDLRGKLNFNGAATIEKIVYKDLGLNA